MGFRPLFTNLSRIREVAAARKPTTWLTKFSFGTLLTWRGIYGLSNSISIIREHARREFNHSRTRASRDGNTPAEWSGSVVT